MARVCHRNLEEEVPLRCTRQREPFPRRFFSQRNSVALRARLSTGGRGSLDDSGDAAGLRFQRGPLADPVLTHPGERVPEGLGRKRGEKICRTERHVVPVEAPARERRARSPGRDQRVRSLRNYEKLHPGSGRRPPSRGNAQHCQGVRDPGERIAIQSSQTLHPRPTGE